MNEPIPTYHRFIDELTAHLTERGSLGLVVLDATAIGSVEYSYGAEAYEEVRQRLFKALEEQRGKDYRAADLLALDEPRGLRFLIFLDRKRRKNLPLTPSDLRAARGRMAMALSQGLARAAFPYLKTAPRIDVGGGLAIRNPLIHPARIIDQAFKDALNSATLLRRNDALAVRERIQDLIIRERIVTAYQPIVKLTDRSVLGYEALSRGARGSGFETADLLFGAAEDNGLLLELDRLCRGRALLSTGRIPSTTRVFVNTLPTTIRDPQFRGKALIDFLAKALVAPDRIVIEITEKLVIENYGLFRETMHYFTDLGMSFAVDDVGAGYSGLESIANLRPQYLKIDISLVRDVHISKVNREMVKAIIQMGRGIGTTVIAEGIQSEDEVRALADLGVAYGQGYHLARPDPGPEPV
jgi:EAL domain-containing protein (putative c-di-GMP-specific phosphodiesterase class I)